ncbi:MAG: hypothetical protein FJW20_11910 [Acidimicrobiia bacterium]|nr:hypothetical protein [Acidimicrobiia bacterium]
MPTRYHWMADTSPEAFARLVELQRNLTPGEKLAMTLEGAAALLRADRDQVRRRFPNADEQEIFLRAAALHLDRETMIKAYGWDPEAHDPRPR